MKPLYGPAMDALGGASSLARMLEPAPGRWDYCARDKVLKCTRAERKGYYASAWWGVWSGWTGDARVTRIDIAVDVPGPMPPFPGCEHGWRIVDSPDGTTYYYDSTECTWRVYRYKTREAVEKHRPLDYIAQIEAGGYDPCEVVRYECELHGSLARAAAAEQNAGAAWSRVKSPPCIEPPRPTAPGPVFAAERRPTLPPASLDAAEARMRKYIDDMARRYAKQTGCTREEYTEEMWQRLARMCGARRRANKGLETEQEVAARVKARRRESASKRGT